MTDIKEFNLVDVRKNSQIIQKLNEVYKLWGYEEVSPSMINDIETIKGREVINQDELISLVSNKQLCLRPEMTTSIVKLISTRLINKKRPLRLWNNGIIFEKKEGYKNSKKIKEKIQSGIELIGYDTKFPEIEIINILFDSIDKLKLKENSRLIFLVSNTSIMELILNKYGRNQSELIKKSMINLDHDCLSNIPIEDDYKSALKTLMFTRGNPNEVINKLTNLFGKNKIIDDLSFLFNTIKPISEMYGIDIQLDPTFQPHLNLYAGIVFQLICINQNEKYVIAKGGRYDELVKYFNPKELCPNGIGFSVSIDNLRKIILTDDVNNKRVLILYKDKELLSKAIDEQKRLHSINEISILELNPCSNTEDASRLMEENGCNDILWIS